MKADVAAVIGTTTPNTDGVMPIAIKQLQELLLITACAFAALLVLAPGIKEPCDFIALDEEWLLMVFVGF